MKPLAVVVPDFPLPPHFGGAVDILRRIRALGEYHCPPVVVSFCRSAPGSESAAELAALSRELVLIPRHWGATAHIGVLPFHVRSRSLAPAEAIRVGSVCRFAAILAESTQCLRAAAALARASGSGLVLRAHNREATLFRELRRHSASIAKRMFYRFEELRFRRVERRLSSWGVRHVFDISSATDVDGPWPGVSSTWLPPISEPTSGEHSVAPGVTCLWVGSLHFEPNLAALRLLLDEIWPRVMIRAPMARLVVAGSRADASTRRWLANRAHVEVNYDPVEIGPVFRAADIFLHPSIAGSGVNMKILDAAAAGLCILSTPQGARGLGPRSALPFFLAATATDFADEAVRLIHDAPQRRAAAERTLKWIGQFSAERHVRSLLEVLAQLAV